MGSPLVREFDGARDVLAAAMAMRTVRACGRRAAAQSSRGHRVDYR
jgi:hypothetical protein